MNISFEQETKIKVSGTASEEIAVILENTFYGTSGPKYCHVSVRDKLFSYTNPTFFQVIAAGETVGCYCLSKRVSKMHGREVLTVYGRYFSVIPSYQGKGFGKLLKQEGIRYISRSVNSPFVLFSYIEKENIKSMKISDSSGFKAYAEFTTISFSRLFPKKSEDILEIADNEKVELKEKIKAMYAEYSFVYLDNLFDHGKYFVKKKNGIIVAGLKATATEWKFKSLPGLSGKFMLKIFPKIPMLNRLFNPASYRFAAVEGIFYEDGEESQLISLFEHALAELKVNSALYSSDSNCKILKGLINSGKLGLMNTLSKPARTTVMIKSSGINAEEEQQLCSSPVYVSAYDMS